VAVHTITVVVPTITVVQVTITTDPTDIGPSTNRVKKIPGHSSRGFSLVSAELFNVRFGP
jgi:hypothetical protein